MQGNGQLELNLLFTDCPSFEIKVEAFWIKVKVFQWTHCCAADFAPSPTLQRFVKPLPALCAPELNRCLTMHAISWKTVPSIVRCNLRWHFKIAHLQKYKAFLYFKQLKLGKLKLRMLTYLFKLFFLVLPPIFILFYHYCKSSTDLLTDKKWFVFLLTFRLPCQIFGKSQLQYAFYDL